MSAFLSHVAGAALPVAIGLLVLTAAARASLWAEMDHTLARRYLEPLSTWCLIAVATHTIALGAAGDARLGTLVFPLGLGIAAAALRPAGEADEASAIEPEKQPAVAAPTTPTDGPLWARRQ